MGGGAHCSSLSFQIWDRPCVMPASSSRRFTSSTLPVDREGPPQRQTWTVLIGDRLRLNTTVRGTETELQTELQRLSARPVHTLCPLRRKKQRSHLTVALARKIKPLIRMTLVALVSSPKYPLVKLQGK